MPQSLNLKDYEFFYPNKMGRVILLAMKELASDADYRAILEKAEMARFLEHLPTGDLDLGFPFEWVSALQATVEAHLGIIEGREFNRRVGRMCLQSGLSEFNPIVGIADLPIRMLPMGMKLHVGFDMFAMVFNRFTDQVVTLSEDDKVYKWVIERCPVCWGRTTDGPCCDLAVGILQEGLSWSTGGKEFNVTQTACIACGDEACVIEIGKRPLK